MTWTEEEEEEEREKWRMKQEVVVEFGTMIQMMPTMQMLWIGTASERAWNVIEVDDGDENEHVSLWLTVLAHYDDRSRPWSCCSASRDPELPDRSVLLLLLLL